MRNDSMKEPFHIPLMVLKNRYVGDNFTLHSVEWNALKNRLVTHTPVASKESAVMFNPVLMKNPDDWIRVKKPCKKSGQGWKWSSYRINANVKAVSMMILDLDDAKGIERFTENKKHFSQFENVVYSTFSHSEKQSKLRVCFPLDKPVLVEDWKELWGGVASLTGSDPSCNDFIRGYIIPVQAFKPTCEPITELNETGRYLNKESMAELLTLAKQLYPQDFVTKIRTPKSFNASSTNLKSVRKKSQNLILPQDPNLKIAELYRNPSVQHFIGECFSENIGCNSTSLKLSAYMVNNYGTEQLTLEDYKNFMLPILKQLPRGISSDTEWQLDYHYKSAAIVYNDTHGLSNTFDESFEPPNSKKMIIKNSIN